MHLRKAGRGRGHREAVLSRGNGADDADPGIDFEGFGGQAEVVGGGRGHRVNEPDGAALARAIRGARLQRCQGVPEAKAESEAGTVEQLEHVLRLYRKKYVDFDLQHSPEKLREEHGVTFSYTRAKTALQEAGLVKRRNKRGSHRKRRPLPGICCNRRQQPRGYPGVTRTVAAVFKASNVAGACSHRFRHTIATEILEMGGII